MMRASMDTDMVINSDLLVTLEVFPSDCKRKAMLSKYFNRSRNTHRSPLLHISSAIHDLSQVNTVLQFK